MSSFVEIIDSHGKFVKILGVLMLKIIPLLFLCNQIDMYNIIMSNCNNIICYIFARERSYYVLRIFYL